MEPTAAQSTLISPFFYWILVSIFAALLYLLLSRFDLKRFYVYSLSIIVPVVTLELVIGFISGHPAPFGTYSLEIPFVGQKTIGTGVMTMRFLDFIFNYGLFRAEGVSYLDSYINSSAAIFPAAQLNATGQVMKSATSSWFNLLILFLASIGNILEIYFYYILFTASIVIASSVFKSDTNIALLLSAGLSIFTGYLLYTIPVDTKAIIIISLTLAIITYTVISADPKHAKIMAAFLSFVPVVAYSILVNDPFSTYTQALLLMEKISMFLSKGTTEGTVLFMLFFFLNFGIIWQIISAILVWRKGASTDFDIGISQWNLGVQGTGFAYTFAFTMVYAFNHYAWYVFFPAAILYTKFKGLEESASEIASGYDERQEIHDFKDGLTPARNDSGEGSGSNPIVWLLIAGIVLLSVLMAWDMKWI